MVYGTEWMWEDAQASPSDKSMGWDCVFLGELFNRMRVKQDLGKELFALFYKMGNVINPPLEKLKTDLVSASQLADKAAADAGSAAKALDNAQSFLATEYDQLVSDLSKKKAQIGAQLVDATQGIQTALVTESAKKTILAATPNQTICATPAIPAIPDQGCAKILGRKVCVVYGTAAVPAQGCVNAHDAAQSAFDQAKNALSTLQQSQTSLQAQVAHLDSQIADAEKRKSNYQKAISSGTLRSAVVVTKRLAQTAKAHLEQLYRSVESAQKAHDQVYGYLNVWKDA